MFNNIICAVLGVVAGLMIGRNNPSLAAAAAKYVASAKADFDAAVAKVQAKLSLKGK